MFSTLSREKHDKRARCQNGLRDRLEKREHGAPGQRGNPARISGHRYCLPTEALRRSWRGCRRGGVPKRRSDPRRSVSSDEVHAPVRPGPTEDSLRSEGTVVRAGGAILSRLTTKSAYNLSRLPDPAFAAREFEADSGSVARYGILGRRRRCPMSRNQQLLPAR